MTYPYLPLVLGIFGLTETPDSPKERDDATKSSITRIYEGTYPQAQGGKPTIGQTFSDLPGDVVVVGVTCEKMPGNKGRLTIEMETPYETTYETEWVEVDKPLILNPRYWDGSTPDLTPAGICALSLQDKAMIEKWEQEDNPVLKGAFQYKVQQDNLNPGTGTAAPTSTTIIANLLFNVYTLSTNAQDYAKKRLKGEEIYRLFAPVVRETSESLTPPAAAQCGLVQGPPDDSEAPENYTYQKSAERKTRTGPYGKYRLQREWQGAEQIDTDLYGTASPNPADP